MRRHQQILDNINRGLGDLSREIVAQNEVRPQWLDPLLLLTLALRASIDVYIFRVRLRSTLHEFAWRHDEIVALSTRAITEGSLQRWPDIYKVWVMYMLIVPRRAAEAFRHNAM